MPAQLGDDDFCRCHLVNHPVCLIDIGISTLIVDRNYRAVLAHTDRAVAIRQITFSGRDRHEY